MVSPRHTHRHRDGARRRARPWSVLERARDGARHLSTFDSMDWWYSARRRALYQMLPNAARVGARHLCTSGILSMASIPYRLFSITLVNGVSKIFLGFACESSYQNEHRPEDQAENNLCLWSTIKISRVERRQVRVREGGRVRTSGSHIPTKVFGSIYGGINMELHLLQMRCSGCAAGFFRRVP